MSSAKMPYQQDSPGQEEGGWPLTLHILSFGYFQNNLTASILALAVILQSSENCMASYNINSFMYSARTIGTAVVRKLSENLSRSNHGWTARSFTANQLDTIIYDVVRVVALPLGLLISGYAAYVILRSVLGPLFNGIDFTMIIPGGGGIPTIGRRKRASVSTSHVSSSVTEYRRRNVFFANFRSHAYHPKIYLPCCGLWRRQWKCFR